MLKHMVHIVTTVLRVLKEELYWHSIKFKDLFLMNILLLWQHVEISDTMCDVTLSTSTTQWNLLEPEVCEWQRGRTVSNLKSCLKAKWTASQMNNSLIEYQMYCPPYASMNYIT
jgi:hypothetical protein